jgi:hypothetical protein
MNVAILMVFYRMSVNYSYILLLLISLFYIITLIIYLNRPKKEGFLPNLPDDRDTCFMAGGDWINGSCMIVMPHPAFDVKAGFTSGSGDSSSKSLDSRSVGTALAAALHMNASDNDGLDNDGLVNDASCNDASCMNASCMNASCTNASCTNASGMNALGMNASGMNASTTGFGAGLSAVGSNNQIQYVYIPVPVSPGLNGIFAPTTAMSSGSIATGPVLQAPIVVDFKQQVPTTQNTSQANVQPVPNTDKVDVKIYNINNDDNEYEVEDEEKVDTSNSLQCD